jgi:xylulokinase
MKAVVGIDIGTQGTKAALYDEGGNRLAQALVASQLNRPAPGVVEEDPENQFQSVCDAIRACAAKAKTDPASIAAIGIDGQMAGILGVDKTGRHVTPYDSWLDTRCGRYIETMEKDAGEEIVAKTGGPPSFNHGPKILWWMHERKAMYRKIAAFVQPGAYAAMRLCGLAAAEAFIDKTYLHFSGFADNQRAAWDASLCRQFKIDPDKLPAIVAPETIVGEVTAEAARKCGLKPGVPVVAGCGDTAASFLACGAVREGICVDVAGTASVFATTTTSFCADQKHRMLACGQSAIAGLWHPYAYINGGGMNLEWFRREFANRGKGGKPLDFAQLNAMAASVAPRDGLPMFVPHLGGRVCPGQPHLRGAWVDLAWDHGVAELYRAVLEGVALEYALYKRTLLDLYDAIPFRELRVTGGGEKSEIWNRIKSDVMQMPVRRITRSDGAPLGAALIAGHGVGLFPNMTATAKKWIAVEDKTPPTKTLASHYAKRIARYGAVLESLNRLPQP